jgi:hypothetical protein
MAVTELTQVGRCNRVGLDIRLASALDETTADWLVGRRAEVVRRPERLGEIFPAVARTVGRNDLGDGWTVDEAARASLVAALAADQSPADLATALSGVYRYGDAAEKRALGEPVRGEVDRPAALRAPVRQRHPARRDSDQAPSATIREIAKNTITSTANTRSSRLLVDTTGQDRNPSQPSSSASTSSATTATPTGAKAPMSTSSSEATGSVSFGIACSLAMTG